MAVSAIRSVMYMIQSMIPFKDITYQAHNIQNIVSNVKLPNVSCIDLDAIYRDYSTNCTYQSCIFPGLIFRPDDSPVVLLIFNSSRIVVTGGDFFTFFLLYA